MTELVILIDEHHMSYPNRYYAILDASRPLDPASDIDSREFALVTGWGSTQLEAAEDLLHECVAQKKNDITTENV